VSNNVSKGQKGCTIRYSCPSCEDQSYEESYAWDDELEGYFLIGEDGFLQEDKKLPDRFLKDLKDAPIIKHK